VNKESKSEMVAELAGVMNGAKAVFIADYRGMDVEESTKLRGELRNAGIVYRVVKNTLLKLAVKDTAYDCLAAHLQGPNALAVSKDDPVAPAKILSTFAKSSKVFEIKVGVLDGKLLTEADVKALAELPSREVLLGKVLGSISAPASNFVGVLAAVPRSFVGVLAAIKDQKAA